MSLKRKGIAAMKWSGFSTVVSIIIQLSQTIIVSRQLDPRDYGLMGMIMVFVTLALAMSDLGISNAIIHRQSATRNELSSLYWLNIGAGAAAALAVFFAAPLAAYFYQEQRLIGPMHAMALLIFVPAIGQQFQVLFQKDLKFDTMAKIEIASFLAGFTVAVSGAYMGYGVYALVWSHIANALLKSICLVVAGWMNWRPEWHFSRRDLKGYLSFGMYQMGTNMTQTIISNLDYMILGKAFGAEKLGYYTFAFQLCSMPVQKLNPLFSKISLPLLAKLQDEKDRLRRVFVNMAGGVSYVSAPIFFGLMVTAPELVPLAFGKQWIPSIALVQLLAGMLLVRSIIMFTSSLMLAKGRADIAFKYTALSIVFILPALALGCYYDGAYGVATAYLLVQFILFGVHYVVSVKSLIGNCLSEYLRNLAPGILGSLMMAGGVLSVHWAIEAIGLFESVTEMSLALEILAGMGLYAAALGAFNKDKAKQLIARLRTKPDKLRVEAGNSK